MKLFFVQARSDRSPKNQAEQSIQDSIISKLHRTFAPENEVNHFIESVKNEVDRVNAEFKSCRNLTMSIQRMGGIHDYKEILLWIQNQDLAVVTISLVECKKGTYLRYIS